MKLFKHMCNFGAWAEWREGRRVVSSYLDVDTTKDQCRLLNPTPLDCIAGYITEDDCGDRALKRLPSEKVELYLMVLFQFTVLFLTRPKALNR